ELLVLGQRVRMPKVPSGLLCDRGWNDVVKASADNQERRTMVVGKVNSRRCTRIEIGKCSLEQNPARTRYSIAVVCCRGLRLCKRICERVMELLRSEHHRPVRIRRISQRGKPGPQGR